MNKLYRSNTDKVIGGVCGGLGEYLHIDPLILRILFVLLAMVNGVGLAAYVILWILVPASQATYTSQEEMVRHNVQEIGQRARELGQEARQALDRGQSGAKMSGNQMLVIGVVLAAIGLLILLNNFHLLWWFNLGKLWPLILIAIGGVILLNNLKGRR